MSRLEKFDEKWLKSRRKKSDILRIRANEIAKKNRQENFLSNQATKEKYPCSKCGYELSMKNELDDHQEEIVNFMSGPIIGLIRQLTHQYSDREARQGVEFEETSMEQNWFLNGKL